MDALQVVAVLAGLIVLATAIGVAWQLTTGRARRASGRFEVDPDADVTLLQFSSEVCAPCRATARVLREVATDRIRHVELDVAEHLALVRRFNILQTPTTLVIDRGGEVRARIGGAIRRPVIDAELERILVS